MLALPPPATWAGGSAAVDSRPAGASGVTREAGWPQKRSKRCLSPLTVAWRASHVMHSSVMLRVH
eukprot:15475182-Alexandrium_andersonii.AAC.1